MKSPFVRRKAACQAAEPGVEEGQPDVLITVVTGDRRGAGTDSKVFLVLHDEQGRASSTLRLTNRMITNCRGQTSTFKRQSGLPNLRAVTAIELWLEKFGVGAAWFVERICVDVLQGEGQAVFPVLRWVHPSPHHLTLTVHDCLLPQHTPERLLPQRMSDLGHKKEVYRYKQNVKDGPMQVSARPPSSPPGPRPPRRCPPSPPQNIRHVGLGLSRARGALPALPSLWRPCGGCQHEARCATVLAPHSAVPPPPPPPSARQFPRCDAH